MSYYVSSRFLARKRGPPFATEEGKPISLSPSPPPLPILQATSRTLQFSLCTGAATTAAAVAPVSPLNAMGQYSSSAYDCYLWPEVQAIPDAQKAMICWLTVNQCYDITHAPPVGTPMQEHDKGLYQLIWSSPHQLSAQLFSY